METHALVELLLFLAVLAAAVLSIVLFTLPSPHEHMHPGWITEDDFSDEDKKNEGSGYTFFSKRCDSDKALRTETTVHIVVLGDIGRSPRMQYHATSIAAYGGKVCLIGYVESDVLPEIMASRFITVVALPPIPARLRNPSKALFPLITPLKVLYQVWTLYHALGYRAAAAKWMLVQNPPSIPTLLVAQLICFIRKTQLVIDWHNFGYTILAMKLGPEHPLVKLSEWYEQLVAGFATAHFTVTIAMARVLKTKYNIDAHPLHDRPAKQFSPLTSAKRSQVLARIPETAQHAKQIETGTWRLIVSSTSWTPDEDFSILLDALVAYSATVSMSQGYPKILAVITGKGPQKDYYLNQISKLHKEKKLAHVLVKTAWLSMEDYAVLLGAADLGVCLHTSSSGVDLPMKVVDMFGAGLPVVGWDRYESWKELVHEGVDGCGFGSAEGLENLLEDLFGKNVRKLHRLREGALQESKRRWEDEWGPVATKVLQIRDPLNVKPMNFLEKPGGGAPGPVDEKGKPILGDAT